jgi:hypothetical protein
MYGASVAQLQFIPSLIIAKFVEPSKAALACLRVLVVQKVGRLYILTQNYQF